MKLIPLLALLALGAALAVSSGASHALAVTNCTVDASIDSEEQAFLVLINEHRAANGVPPLVLSNTLNAAAAWKSQHMADEDYFAHDDVPIGRTWVQRIRDCGYSYNTFLGENIAAGNSTAAATFEQWRNSPGHNANMLGSNYVAIGIGRAYNAGSTFRWYWTTDFGGFPDGPTSPTPTPDEPAPTPTSTAPPPPTSTPQPTATSTPPPPPPSGNDSDGDGCDDAFELGSNQVLGGLRDPNNPWDFFDTPNAANERDQAVSIADVGRVVARFGSSGDPTGDPFSPPPATGYHTAFDRSAAPPGEDLWDLGPPNGDISVADIGAIVAQFGHTCVGASEPPPPTPTPSNGR